jgi:hypothetical protein
MKLLHRLWHYMHYSTVTDSTYCLVGKTRSLAFVDGDFETIHQALGTYLLRQMKVDAGYSGIMMVVFD